MNDSGATSDPAEKRFAFGQNWQQFLRHVNEERVAAAEQSLQRLLGRERLDGRTFLDVGCGSGLFSLAARRLGAEVHSFDYDEASVACAQELKRRFSPADEHWQIEQGSILDLAYLQGLPRFDIVYAWGVLHHTGAMWDALANVDRLVAPGGLLAVAIYNDQGGASRRWRAIKRLYVTSPAPLRGLLVGAIGGYQELRQALVRLLRLQSPLPFADWARLRRDRGMSAWHDLIDWVGGYPFEVATPAEIFTFFHDRGYTLRYLTTQRNGYGCNEFTFERPAGPGGS